jgi:uncharacterized protein YdhG (YjbR/CyaY superfamily)
MKHIKNVDDYIASTPKEVQNKLKELRAVIKKTAPDAQERIGYGMPYYGYKGRLVYFGLSKNHIGLYIPPPIIKDHKKDLVGFGTSKSAIRFPSDKKLPFSLIKKLILARINHNDKSKK